MSRAHVPAALRQLVVERAGNRCEYCLFPQEAAFSTFQVEHIIAEKHGGATIADNLALACTFCNQFKGTDLGSLDPATGQLTPFFHPRLHRWADHFRLDGTHIVPLTPEGRVTVAILQVNRPERIMERQSLVEVGLYP